MDKQFRQADKETEGFFIGLFVFAIVFVGVFLLTYSAISYAGGLPGNAPVIDLEILKSFVGQKIPGWILSSDPWRLNEILARWFLTIVVFCCVVSSVFGFWSGLVVYRFWVGQGKKINGRYTKRG